MTYSERPLEISNQIFLLPSEDYRDELSIHMPLYDLALDAPSLHQYSMAPADIRFPVSNDPSTAGHFDQLQARSHTAEYQQAENRVAVVVGESGLASNLAFIPEETVVILDNSPAMCRFMEIYVDTLRTATDPEAWIYQLSMYASSSLMSNIEAQKERWQTEGYPSAFSDLEIFLVVQRAARHKAIVAWHGDITKAEDMEHLGNSLRIRNANVTMMNLTNVLSYNQDFFMSPLLCASTLSNLPLTRNAPILTTSLQAPLVADVSNLSDFLDSTTYPDNLITGPFFGLDNLARAALDMPYADVPLGRIEQPHYSQEVEYGNLTLAPEDNPILYALMEKFAQFSPTNEANLVINPSGKVTINGFEVDIRPYL